MIKNDNFRNTYYYDSEGLRSRKNIYIKNSNGGYDYNGKVMYKYLGGLLTYQCTYNSADEVDNEMYFFYDSYSKLTAIRYIKGSINHYYYVTTNKQGDVLGIYSASGALLASYDYDAWGNCTVNTVNPNYTIGNDNPIRYRSYYFDTDTGLYYLQSRYYDATIGRFINADGYVTTGQGVLSYNMFAYCMNNPIAFSDPSGCSAISVIVAIAIVAVFAITLSSCSSNESTSTVSPYSNQANCYAYAMKLENDPRTGEPFQSKPQPGEFSGNGLTYRDLYGDSETVKNNINKKVIADAEVLNLNYIEVSSANHTAKPGNWVVALAYATDGSDYHWYRRNDDGSWSHKPGSTPIINWDAAGQTISDPATCDRGIYDGFLGYYEVGPN